LKIELKLWNKRKKEKKSEYFFPLFAESKKKRETKLHLNSEKASKNFFDMEE
jgi:hypothetical protein